MSEAIISEPGEEGSTFLPPPGAPVPLTFDINWIDPERSPVMFVGITGSNIDNRLLTLHGDRVSHVINLDGVSHVNIWEEHE